MTKNEEEAVIEVMQHIFELMNDCVETKKTNELEIMLGDENTGDKLLVSISYLKTNNKKVKKQTKVILN